MKSRLVQTIDCGEQGFHDRYALLDKVQMVPLQILVDEKAYLTGLPVLDW